MDPSSAVDAVESQDHCSPGNLTSIFNTDTEKITADKVDEMDEQITQQINEFPKLTLGEIIMQKIKQKESGDICTDKDEGQGCLLPPKVVEVFTSVGKMLAKYKSGKIPKAVTIMPSLDNWEEVRILAL